MRHPDTALDVGVACKFLGRARQTEPAVLQHVAATGELERSGTCCSATMSVRPASRSLASARYASTASLGASPVVGSSSINTFGLDINARPTASICCSPPLMVPAF